MDNEVLSFVNLRLLIDSIYKHVTRALFILSAFRISSTFHLYCLASMSMTLSLARLTFCETTRNTLPRPASRHFCLALFCRGLHGNGTTRLEHDARCSAGVQESQVFASLL